MISCAGEDDFSGANTEPEPDFEPEAEPEID